jgi:hypothetical protein
MKRIIPLLVSLLLVITAANAQSFDNNCTVDKFPYAYAYGQYRGAGAEFGVWPQDNLIGGAVGITFISERVTKVKTETTPESTTTEWRSTIYTKGLLRVNRFVYITGLVGAYDLTEGYYGIGTRLSAPIGRGNLCTVALEPQYTSRGGNLLAGLGFALQ